eukprot:TRINITY_DN3677_c0_g2_i1.p1 TRINITY_DN3677_c0_g2~~TRINITY_DN3677_c0_g2_i1.p1  ORF type:complete len:413 (+),score=108.33 TRINITY_DN3677_c0_g2_i1:78-1241(+)
MPPRAAPSALSEAAQLPRDDPGASPSAASPPRPGSPPPAPAHKHCACVPNQYREVVFYAAGFSVSSSLLVVINKWALLRFPYGATLTAIQFGVSALVAKAIGVFGIDEVDPLRWNAVLAFIPAVVLFYVSVATNLKLLEHAHVDTYIVTRSLVPISTLGLEMAVLKSPWPGMATFCSLVLILVGACGYVATDRGFNWAAYTYAATYLVAFTVDQVLIKKIVTDVKLTRWGLVYYNNVLALCLMPIGGWVTGEWSKLNSAIEKGALSALFRWNVLGPVLVSCVFGVSISFFALNARRSLTATAFTVLGVVCKFFTVFINTAVWDQHASPFGVACVCVCIAGGVLFQQLEKSRVMTIPKTRRSVDGEAKLSPVVVAQDMQVDQRVPDKA